MSPLTPHTKIYIDKAVQTTKDNNVSLDSSKLVQNTLGLVSSDTLERSTASVSEEKITVLDAAPIYSSSSDRLCPLPPQLSPSRSPLASRRIYKHPQLPYSRPTQASNAEKRVVSFPETVSVENSGINLTVPAAAGPSLRVVSLPKLGRQPLSESPTTTEGNLSLEYLETSTDMSSWRSSRTGSMHLQIRNFPPSDMPTTPSPPSSPESMLFIHNDPHVTMSFLRETGLSPNSAFGPSKDEAGWITWASSPPRPIPALHGPLSLPYARCPSGAEGTIIEDADLPRMIWGLDLDEVHSNPARNLSSVSNTKTQHPRPVTASQNAFLDTASRVLFPVSPSSHMCSLATHNPESKENWTPGLGRPLAKHTDTSTKDSRANCSRNQHMCNDTSIQILGPLDRCGTGYFTRAGDVRAGWQDVLTPSTEIRYKTSDLKSSAPSFIPSNLASKPGSATYPRIFVEPRTGSQITAGRRLSAIEIAQRYQIEQQRSALLTPPTSSSPTWSPTFSGHSSSLLPPQEPGVYNSWNALPKRPYISEPIPPSGRDFTEELRQIEAAKRELSGIIGLPGITSLDFNFSAGSNIPNHLSPIPLPQDTSHRSSPVIDMSLILKHLPTVSHPTNPQIQATISPNTPRLNVPTAQQQNLLGQKPQSIPLTRLIQRRLSSVMEEEAISPLSPGSPPSDSCVQSHPHPANKEDPSRVAFSKSDELDAKIVYDGHKWKKSKSDGKVTVAAGANINEGRKPHKATIKDNKEKENTSSTGKGTNIENSTPRKKWRLRKKTGGS